MYALTIVMENAGHGGAMAAPLAREIFTACFSTATETARALGAEVMGAGSVREGDVPPLSANPVDAD